MNSISKLSLAMAVGAVAAMASTQASAAAFQNGSFELPGLSVGNRLALGSTLTINGWLSDGNTVGEAVFYQATGFADFQARDGLAGIGFGGSGGSGGQIGRASCRERV